MGMSLPIWLRNRFFRWIWVHWSPELNIKVNSKSVWRQWSTKCWLPKARLSYLSMRFILWSEPESWKVLWMLPIFWNRLWHVVIWELSERRPWMNIRSISNRTKRWSVVSRRWWSTNRMWWVLSVLWGGWKRNMKITIRWELPTMRLSLQWNCPTGIFPIVSSRIRLSTWSMRLQPNCG